MSAGQAITFSLLADRSSKSRAKCHLVPTVALASGPAMSKSTISDAPELAPPRKVIHAYSDEYPTPLPTPKTYYDSGYTPTGPSYSTAPEYVETPQPEHKKTILGLRRRSFWILVAMMVFLLAATVGASVGGTIAVQNRK
jgi:hypothetical protein